MSENATNLGSEEDSRRQSSERWLPTTLRRWASERTFAIVRGLVLAGCALLFLDAAATVEVVYTLRPAYLLIAIACCVGAPFVVEGWRNLPLAIRAYAGVLVACYIVSAVFGTSDRVETGRGGSGREVIYLLDLGLGLATVGLLGRLFSGREHVCPALAALVVGGLVAAVYGVIQWPARHYDWPIANVNNALNPDAVTRGEVHQGEGLLLGWERVRGTFTEPLFFGLYLGTILPLVMVWLAPTRRRLVACSAAGALFSVALLLASSFPSWSLFIGAALTSLLVFAISRGATLPSALVGGTLAASATAVALVLFGSPEYFEKVTGREGTERAVTASSRTMAWEKAIRSWSEHPIIGHGPGQSSVQLAHLQDPRVVNTETAPLVLGSAQGLLTAALVDVGVVGAVAWSAFLAACLAVVARALWRRPTTLHLALSTATLVAVGGGLVSGDRLELRHWIVVGLALAVSGHAGSGWKMKRIESQAAAAREDEADER